MKQKPRNLSLAVFIFGRKKSENFPAKTKQGGARELRNVLPTRTEPFRLKQWSRSSQIFRYIWILKVSLCSLYKLNSK